MIVKNWLPVGDLLRFVKTFRIAWLLPFVAAAVSLLPTFIGHVTQTRSDSETRNARLPQETRAANAGIETPTERRVSQKVSPRPSITGDRAVKDSASAG